MDVFAKTYPEYFRYFYNTIFNNNYLCCAGIGSNKKPIINPTDEDYLFLGVRKRHIYQKIQEFRLLDYSSIWDLIKLAGLCRSIIVLYSKFLKTTKMVNLKNIPQYIIDQEALFTMDTIFFLEPVPEDFLTFIEPEIEKAKLLFCDPLKWRELISFINEHYPQKIFHSFDFENCLFFIYLCSYKPEFYDKYISNYEKDLLTYVECLAGAIKSFMTFIGLNKYINNNDNQSHKNKTLSEIIFIQFLDCFLEDQKNNKESYFNKIKIPSNKKRKKKTE